MKSFRKRFNTRNSSRRRRRPRELRSSFWNNWTRKFSYDTKLEAKSCFSKSGIKTFPTLGSKESKALNSILTRWKKSNLVMKVKKKTSISTIRRNIQEFLERGIIQKRAHRGIYSNVVAALQAYQAMIQIQCSFKASNFSPTISHFLARQKQQVLS